MAEKKRGLGRGLSALIGDALADEENNIDAYAPEAAENVTSLTQGDTAIRMVGLDQLVAGKFQPRRKFDDAKAQDLVRSIEQKGVLQPLLVRPLAGDNDRYEIIAGERRWRAAQKAKIHDIPVIIRAFNDREALEIGIIENVQRADLNAIEEAQAYIRLMQEFDYTQEQLAQTLGKTRSYIANILRLNGLDEAVQFLLIEGKLTPGHARALVNYPDALGLAKKIIAEGLSVRAVEKIISNHGKMSQKPPSNAVHNENNENADIRAFEHKLSEVLGLNISIDHDARKGGVMSIRYNSLDQLDYISRRLGVQD